MAQNRVFALVFRLAAFALCLLGVLGTVGVFRGVFNGEILLFYTTLTNVMVLALFALLAVRTALDIRAQGIHGPASYHERLEAIVMLAIGVTMLVFWLLLAPTSTDTSFLRSPLNLQIHLFTPLLMIFDYFCFAQPGKLKKQDPWLFALIPLTYFFLSTMLGLAGYVYSTPAGGSRHFPYFFLDFYQQGAWVLAYSIAILAFFVGLAFLLLLLDRKRAARRALLPEQST